MKANSPTENDLAVTQLIDESTEATKLSNEQKQLAKVGSGQGWTLIKDYLEERIDAYKKGLFGEDLAGKPADVIGNRFLAAQTVIQEFEKLIDEVETTTKAVKEADDASS